MKNTVKLTLILVLLFLVVIMEIILKINSNKASTVTLPVPTKIVNNTQSTYSSNQPTKETIKGEDVVTNEVTPTMSVDSEVGPTLTESQSEELIETNEKTGGFHSFIAPEDNGSDIPDTNDE
jgi:hypothetical protein